MAALWDVVNDFEKNHDAWENTELPQYLEALCLLLMSIENSYANIGRPIPEDPWLVIADALKGARFYELVAHAKRQHRARRACDSERLG